MKKIYAGVDGGGTKTRALIVTEDGICCECAHAGASNPNTAGTDAAVKNLVQALRAGTEKIGAKPEFEAAFFGLSGVNDSVAASYFTKRLAKESEIVLHNFLVENDTRSLCAAAFPASSGIVLIAGTGSKCYGRTSDGREWEAGGYDFHVSDEASAFDLARRGLIAAVRAADGRGEPTLLKEMLFNELQIAETGQISQRLHQDSLKNPGKPMTKDEIAALAIFVDKAFLSGDAVAKQILESAMADLVIMVQTVARKLELSEEPLRIGITGGVILNEPCKTIFTNAMKKAAPNCEIFVPENPPVLGAAMRALSLGGVVLTPKVMENLKRSFKEI